MTATCWRGMKAWVYSPFLVDGQADAGLHDRHVPLLAALASRQQQLVPMRTISAAIARMAGSQNRS